MAFLTAVGVWLAHALAQTFHSVLKAAAETGHAVYILRHHAPETLKGKPLRVSGYGVELDIKKIAYIAVDDAKIEVDGKGATASIILLYA